MTQCSLHVGICLQFNYYVNGDFVRHFQSFTSLWLTKYEHNIIYMYTLSHPTCIFCCAGATGRRGFLYSRIPYFHTMNLTLMVLSFSARLTSRALCKSTYDSKKEPFQSLYITQGLIGLSKVNTWYLAG